VRSTLAAPIEAAQVFALAGRLDITTVEALNDKAAAGNVQRAFARPAKAAGARAGDLERVFSDVAPGELTVCAIPLTKALIAKQNDIDRRKLELRCVAVAAGATAAVVETPPQRRFD
jgi:hypothetical protein